MTMQIKKDKLNKAFFLLSIIIIVILAFLLLQKRFGLYFKKAPFSLKLVRVIGAGYRLKGPAGVAFGKRNNIYVVDSGNSRILKFNIRGRYIRQWGIEGKTTGEFMVPLFAAAHGNPERIYVVDSGNSRIQVFKPNGDFVYEFGISKNQNRMLIQATCVAFSDGKIYVANSGADDIMVYSKNGNFYESIGNSLIKSNEGNVPSEKINGSGSAVKKNKKGNKNKKNSNSSNISGKSAVKNLTVAFKLKKPVSITFSKKYIYVSDYGLSKILVFNRQFDYIGAIGIKGQSGHRLYHPVGIVYRSGYLYVANYGRSILTVFKLAGGYNVVKAYNFGTPGIGKNNFNHESNISMSLNGKYIAIADTNNNRVLIYRIFGS
ncbi:MAG: NHL repeat-containing protein [Deltaproteobacteria bacterium]|nr:NHL repeat-containing protein [Deltaproteobacteria bacterium]